MCYSVGNVWCCFLVAASEPLSDIVEKEQLRLFPASAAGRNRATSSVTQGQVCGDPSGRRLSTRMGQP